MSDHGYVAVRSLARQPLFEGKGPLLPRLDVELTERCNNACMHCYINLPARDRTAARRELTAGEWGEILRQAAELGALSVRFTGGEPLLRPDFAEIYLSARRLGLKVMLFTNGRLITPELADLFARVPPLMKVELSVYGMRPESYDAVARAPGAFAEFRRGVDLLLERRNPFRGQVGIAAAQPRRDRRVRGLGRYASLDGPGSRLRSLAPAAHPAGFGRPRTGRSPGFASRQKRAWR